MSSTSRSSSQVSSHVDPITLDVIPREQMIKLGRHPFNSHALATMIHQGITRNPLTREPVTPEQQRIVMEIARRTGWNPAVHAENVRRQRLSSMHDLIGHHGGTTRRAVEYADKVVGFLERLSKAIIKRHHRTHGTEKIIIMDMQSVLLRSDVLDYSPTHFTLVQPGVASAEVYYARHIIATAPVKIKLTFGKSNSALSVTLLVDDPLIDTPETFLDCAYKLDDHSRNVLLPGYTMQQSIRTFTPTAAVDTRSTKGILPLAFIAAVTYAIGLHVKVLLNYRGYEELKLLIDILQPHTIAETSSEHSEHVSTTSSSEINGQLANYMHDVYVHEWRDILSSLTTMFINIGQVLRHAPPTAQLIPLVNLASLRQRPASWRISYEGGQEIAFFKIKGIQAPELGPVTVHFDIINRARIGQVVFETAGHQYVYMSLQQQQLDRFSFSLPRRHISQQLIDPAIRALDFTLQCAQP